MRPTACAWSMPVPSLLRRSLSPRRSPGNEETLMEKPEYRSALIVGTGPGLSASLARLFAKNGLAVSVAARQTDKLAALAKETGADIHACNAADPKEVAGLFAALDAGGRTAGLVVYNPSGRGGGALAGLPPGGGGRAAEGRALRGFLVSPHDAHPECAPHPAPPL